MIVGNRFENDNNEALKNVQEKSYGQSLSSMFNVAKKQYITADSILQANHPNIPLLNKINSFDHRVLQAAHDNIAAAFRYRNQNIKQLNLFDNIKDEPNEYMKLWKDWLCDELSELKENANFVRNVIEAVIHSNEEQGYAAEDRLHELLVNYYAIEE
ncbi:hypothetical protein NNA33_12490 [Marisediminitalea aggregata]|uniref:hypothetical protein n=1 Tax=Marisediminitalea aggregata TaxID=634436 RepID=UPI0020CDFA68|nr:hypothetical protein [Marisediminitalea aggregata]MCP9478738.1 hypothetical protein [Marisediminitalea aggregata]